jgi:hypothetical protein
MKAPGYKPGAFNIYEIPNNHEGISCTAQSFNPRAFNRKGNNNAQ